MISEITENTIDLKKFKPGLIFDADGVCLFGKYYDEISAWRGKRKWIEVLHEYFLLEPERDYEISVISELESNTFCLSCSFESACGRYTFWRLINHQAPEAEEKLGGTIGQSIESQFSPEMAEPPQNETWILTPLGESISHNSESTHLLKRILKIFR